MEPKCVWQRCQNEVVVGLEFSGELQWHCVPHLIAQTQLMIHELEVVRGRFDRLPSRMRRVSLKASA